MPTNPISKLDSRLRAHRLGSAGRIGQYARDSAWKKILTFTKRNKKALAVTFVMPLVVSLPVLPFIRESGRWFIVGVAGISGPWLAVVMTILWSGVADTLMGLDAETSTSNIFKTLRRQGWVVANGLMTEKNGDIDHVVVGPAGILIVESKWSQHRWPMNGYYNKRVSRTLEEAVTQVLRNRADFELQFAKVLGDVVIQPVCVLWSSEDSSKDAESLQWGDVSLVRGPALESWLKELSEVKLTQHEIDRLIREIEAHSNQRHLEDLANSKSHRPTLSTFFMRSVLTPIFATIAGLLSALYGLLAIGHIHPSWLFDGSLLFMAIGVGALRVPHFRRFALGWIGTSAAFVVIDLILEILNRIH